jgi:DNA polymerase-3 subunit gamma/tau
MIASGAVAAPAGPANAAAAPAASAPGAVDWAALIRQVDQSGQLRVAQVMHDWIRVIELAPMHLRFDLAPGFSGDPAPDLRDALLRATGERWLIERGGGEGMLSLREMAEALREAELAEMRRSPLVEAALAAFPGAEFVEEAAARGDLHWSKSA